MKNSLLHRVVTAKIARDYAKMSKEKKASLSPKDRDLAEKASSERNARLKRKKR